MSFTPGDTRSCLETETLVTETGFLCVRSSDQMLQEQECGGENQSLQTVLFRRERREERREYPPPTDNAQQVEGEMNLFNESRDCLTNKGILRHSLLGGRRKKKSGSIACLPRHPIGPSCSPLSPAASPSPRTIIIIFQP